MAPSLEFEEEFEEMLNIVEQQTDSVNVVAVSHMSMGTAIYLAIFFTLLIMSFTIIYLKMMYWGQKTRTPAQRRMYAGSRARQSLSQTEPTIYVSPSNLPPPPKYECLAPPSYEEVVGIHYPQYQVQPITQPITSAMAQASGNVTVSDAPATVITVTSERRTSLRVASS